MGAYRDVTSTPIISGGKRGGIYEPYEPSASRARSRPGVRLGLPASAEGRGRGQEGQGRLRRRDARLYYAGKTRIGDEPSARVLHPATRHPDGVFERVGPHFLLRMEGPRRLLRHRDKGRDNRRGEV